MPIAPQEFITALRTVWRLARWALAGLVVLVLLSFAAEVHHFYLLFAAIHPLVGAAFLLAVAFGVWWLIGKPVWAYLRMPVAVTPPLLPTKEQGLSAWHLARHLDHVGRYLRAQRGNPLLAEQQAEIVSAIDACLALRAEVAMRPDGQIDISIEAIRAFETERVEPLLAPLDAEAERLIRQEAIGVGVATAVALNGTMDALIVLWRNVNLIARVARVYYGRPGARGSLVILRDVFGAVVVSNYLESVTTHAGNLLGRWAGHIAGVVAGPLLNGGANAILTLRLGYLARTRCRAFQAWTEEQRRSAVLRGFEMAKEASGAILTEIASRVGGVMGGVGSAIGTVASTAVSAGNALFQGTVDLLTRPFRKTGETEEEPVG